MRLFTKDLREELRAPVVVSAWVVLTIVMALVGPFGSYDPEPLWRRLLVWACLVALAVVMTLAVTIVIRRQWELPGFWRQGVVTSALVALILAVPLRAVADILGDESRFLPASLTEIALFVFCLTLGFFAFRHARALTDDEQPGAGPRLLERLPEALRGGVMRVSGRDHYVEIATEKGTASVLLRFSDALAELDGADGLQVHRSHWVAGDAVTGTAREGGRIFLRLANGPPVPVSRTYLAAVEARGWLVQA